jgi:renalase
VACARRLHDAGVPVRLIERAHRLGGRMASRTEEVDGRRHVVDIGAPYFTVRDPGFAEVVAGWEAAGLVRPWTDTFDRAGPDGDRGRVSGPVRWASTGGLRGLVEALAEGLDVRLEVTAGSASLGTADGEKPSLDGETASAIVLAMPDPQAARLLPAPVAAALGVAESRSTPVLTVWAAWPHRWWPAFDGVFVDSPVLTWVADSGRARGDGAAVLVAHTTGDVAAQHLDDPLSVVPVVMDELRHVVGGFHGSVPPPIWERVHRWSMASARRPHPEPFALTEGPHPIGVAGDGWGPRSRVEQAWTSGDGLAREIAGRLAVPF